MSHISCPRGLAGKLRRFFEIIQHTIFPKVIVVHRYDLNLICVSTQTFMIQYGRSLGQLLPPHENETVLQMPQAPPF